MQTSLCCESPLLQSLVKHFEHIPSNDLDQIMRLVARFTSNLLDSAGLNRELSNFPMNQRHAVRSWRRWALSSFYWGSLWRALISRDCKQWRVKQEDVDFILFYLSAKDRKRLGDLYYIRSVSRLNPDVILDMQQTLRKHAWSLYYKHLRFVAMYDTGISPEDLVSAILEAGLKALRRYEHQNNPRKTLNYAKRTAKNAALNLIVCYTRRKRACLVPVEGEDSRQYLQRTVSYEDNILRDRRVTDLPIFDKIRVELGPEYERYARAILGSWPAFDEWVVSRYATAAENLPRRRLERFAREFSGITVKQAHQQLAPFLTDSLRRKHERENWNHSWSQNYFASSMPM